MDTDCKFSGGAMKYSILIMFVFMLASCFKDDNPVTLPLPGNVENFQVGMGKTYDRQVYFDLGTEDTLGSLHTAWDLCFESSDTGWHVWLNGGNMALSDKTDTQNFDIVTDTIGAKWKWDEASWNTDSTAIGDWRNDRIVYIIDRGANKAADGRFKKIIFQSYNESTYEIQYANLDGSNQKVFDVQKNNQNAYVYFTFENDGTVLNIEPESQHWDILFTRYRYIFYEENPPLPYLVNGVLINPSIAVAIDSSMTFSEIDYSKVQSMHYSSTRDVIGWNWKYFNFTSQGYMVKSNINYIIRDLEGFYWKLHFTDFYNFQGEPGYPQFEFQRL
jgi:hypothetical protein